MSLCCLNGLACVCIDFLLNLFSGSLLIILILNVAVLVFLWLQFIVLVFSLNTHLSKFDLFDWLCLPTVMVFSCCSCELRLSGITYSYVKLGRN